MTQVPTSFELDKAVAFVEALGYGSVFGKGTMDDPLFPVDVQLTGDDGNVYSITGRVEKAIRGYLRTTEVSREHARAIEAAIRRELWSGTYADVLTTVLCLVNAH